MNETRLRELIAEAVAPAAIQALATVNTILIRHGRRGKTRSTASYDANRSASRLRERRG